MRIFSCKKIIGIDPSRMLQFTSPFLPGATSLDQPLDPFEDFPSQIAEEITLPTKVDEAYLNEFSSKMLELFDQLSEENLLNLYESLVGKKDVSLVYLGSRAFLPFIREPMVRLCAYLISYNFFLYLQASCLMTSSEENPILKSHLRRLSAEVEKLRRVDFACAYSRYLIFSVVNLLDPSERVEGASVYRDQVIPVQLPRNIKQMLGLTGDSPYELWAALAKLPNSTFSDIEKQFPLAELGPVHSVPLEETTPSVNDGALLPKENPSFTLPRLSSSPPPFPAARKSPPAFGDHVSAS